MGHRVSAKQNVKVRRVRLKDGTTYSIRPSFLMPYMTADGTQDVQGPLFLRTFGVPFWPRPMSLAAIRCIGIGWCAGWAASASWEPPSARRRCPRILLADEHHQPLDGQKVYIATTVADGCCWARSRPRRRGPTTSRPLTKSSRTRPATSPPSMPPKTVSTDGWKGTQAAWKALFQRVMILQCFLHAWLKIRDSGQALEITCSRTSPAGSGRRFMPGPHRRSFGQRLRWLRQWATRTPHGDRP